VPGKVPSALEIFLNYNSFNDTSNYSPAPSQSAPIVRMKALWEQCTSSGQKLQHLRKNEGRYRVASSEL
jgi:hypothetical protein